jgi:hypothetical protein
MQSRGMCVALARLTISSAGLGRCGTAGLFAVELRMLLELGRVVSFFLSIAALYAVAINTFFIAASHWRTQLSVMLLHLAVAACVCLGSGMLFAYPGDRRLTATMPVRLFLWALAILPVLFAVGWYISCGNPLRDAFGVACG